MTKKKLILVVGLILLCLLVCLCTVLCAPSGDKPTEESTETQTTVIPGTTGSNTWTYSIEIKNEGGQPLEEIGVYIYTDSTMQELVWFAKTDAEGCLSFEDVASDNFVAVLSDVPAGYLVEEYYLLTGETTRIVLESGLMEGDLSTLSYKLGDLVLDFTVTGPDGSEYVFSELLKQKKAIVLNFWYLQCEPCKSEFPYLQEAYEKYDEDVIVLAMNPVNTTDEEIAAFQKENGYTFPMVKCDPAWEKAMQITAYPTTVVIDRFGNICLIHKGSITEAETFETMFDFFSADDYTQSILESVEDLEEAAGVEQTVGTKDNPLEIGVTPSFQLTIEPGQSMYCNFYRISGTLYLSVNDPSISVTHMGTTYNGSVYFPVTAEGTSSLVEIIFTNTGTETKTYTVSMGRAAGTYDNPYSLKLGEFTAKVGAGNETGVYYTYVAEKDGLFVVDVQKVTAGVDYNIIAYNLTTYALRNSQDDGSLGENGYKSVGVNVSKGDKISVTVGTLPDSSNSYPAATFQLKADIREGESEGTTQQKTLSYSVNVTDENRKPIANVMMRMKVDNADVTMITNAEGFAITTQKAGSYPVVLTIPTGYAARTTEFTLTEQYPSVSIKLEKLDLEEITYTVRVLDAQGSPIVGAYVYIGTAVGITNEEGIAEVIAIKGTYLAEIVADGFAVGKLDVSPESADAEIALEEDDITDKVEYTVKALDYQGNPVSGVILSFKLDGAVRGTAVTDGNGVAVCLLKADTYTVGAADFFTEESSNILTEDSTSVTVTLYPGFSGEMGDIYDNPTPILTEGAVYLNGLQNNDYNYFLFAPGEGQDGLYRITGLCSDAELSYWGSNTNFLTNQTSNSDYNSATNSMTLNIKPANIGSNYVFGLSGDTYGVVLIQRIGDAELDITDMDAEAYVAKNQIDDSFTLTIPAGKKLTYVDVFGETVTYHRDSEGYYHLNSATGPILYVNLGKTAPYLAMSNCMGITDEHGVYNLNYVYYDENGTPVRKESYNSCMTEYVKARCEKTDVYPLTDDLVFMFQQANVIKGWGDIDNPNYLFYDSDHQKIPGVNPEIVWMYAVCYLK